MNRNISSLSNLRKLLKLQQSRIVIEERLLNQAKKEYEVAKNEFEQRYNQINEINAKKQIIQKYLSKKEAIISPAKQICGYDNRYWLNYDLEMHEYYLEQERESMKEKKHDYDIVLKRWIKLKKKIEKLSEIYTSSNINKRNTQDDKEIEESIDDRAIEKENINGK